MLNIMGMFLLFPNQEGLPTYHVDAVPFRIAGSFPVGMKKIHYVNINASFRISLLRCSQNGTYRLFRRWPPPKNHTHNKQKPSDLQKLVLA